MSTNERDELIEILHQTATADRVRDGALDRVPVVAAKVAEVADAILAAGYRKPKVLGYLVVDRGGVFVGNPHKHRESAQAFADEWTADCKTAGIDWEYRVTEIVEPQP